MFLWHVACSNTRREAAPPRIDVAGILPIRRQIMDRYKNIFSFVACSTLVLVLAVVASAQYRDRRGNNDYYGNRDISGAVKSLKNQARQFEKLLDRELDRSRYDGTSREDFLNDIAKRFKNDAEDLDDEYKGSRNQRESADEARRVINTGSQLQGALRNSRIGRNSPNLFNSWRAIDRNLDIVANAYNINYNGAGRNGRWGSNDRYGRNDGRNGKNRRGNQGNGRYGRTNGRYGNIGSTINSLKYKARILEDKLDNRRNKRSGTNLENLSDRFKDAVDDLADEYDSRNGGYNEAQRVLSIGEQMDREINGRSVSRDIQRDWRAIEQDLKTIASAYNLRYSGNSGGLGGLGEIFRRWPF